MSDMSPNERERLIRELAYRIWLEEGRPDGRAEVHWRMAGEFLSEEEAANARAVSERGSAPARTPHDTSDGLRGQDKQQADLVDESAGSVHEERVPVNAEATTAEEALPDGLRRERMGPLDRNVGRGNSSLPSHVPGGRRASGR